MKGNFLIIASSLVLVLLLVLWVYLLFFNNPRTPDEIFANFGFGGGAENVDSLPEPVTPEEEPVVDVTDTPLRQLTTRQVIGFTEVMRTASDTPHIYYAEAGTGHLYAINSGTGAEQKISGTTLTGAHKATFSSDGRYVVIQTGVGNGKKTVIGEISPESESLTTRDITDAVEDFSISSSDELLYSVVTENGTLGKAVELATLATKTIFSVPFRESTILWGSEAASTHYLYPKPSAQLEGFLYEVRTGGQLRRLPASGYGFVAAANDGTIGYNTHNGDVTAGKILFTESNTTIDSPILFLPEKCAFSTASSSLWWCAHEVVVQDHTFPDRWYMGLQSFKDMVWEVVLADNTYDMRPLIDTFTATNRQIDVVDMMVNSSDSVLYFKNKNDNTLWSYEL